MMLLELLAAASVGISFSNAWLCMGLSFGCRGESKKVGARFILGRFIGLCILGVAISLVGAILDIPPIYFVAIFGVASVLFGLLLLVGILGGPGPFKKRLRHALGINRGGDCTVGKLARGEGACEGNTSVAVKDATNNGVKDANESGIRPNSAFVLGILRGATPCVKMMVLAPLLIAVGPLWAVVLSLVYALTSTAYPLIGFLAASAVSQLPRYERALRVVGAFVLILVGIFVLVNETMNFLGPRGD
jgi:cytochrome c biogenesis protein CcdA